jgi:putative ABC transport system substrate-binding protein
VRRREFILAVGGAAAAYPLAARAQQAAMPVIGFLDTRSPGEAASVIVAFGDGLNEVGYTEGRNVAIEYRWAEGRYDRMAGQAADLASRRVAVIFAGGPGAVTAAKTAAPAIPIVFITGQDPVRLGLVASLNRPGGNVTGLHLFSTRLEPKKLELLHEIVPKAAVIGVLMNPTNPSADIQAESLREAARALGLEIHIVDASTESEIDAGFAAMVQRGAGAVLVGNDPFFTGRREQIVPLAARHALPALYSQRESVVAGGLASYGTSITDAYRQMGVYAGRILKGAKPGDLPVVQQTQFLLVINRKTAAALGLEIPPKLLFTADEVIE